jgi:hypothetical protein
MGRALILGSLRGMLAAEDAVTSPLYMCCRHDRCVLHAADLGLKPDFGIASKVTTLLDLNAQALAILLNKVWYRVELACFSFCVCMYTPIRGLGARFEHAFLEPVFFCLLKAESLHISVQPRMVCLAPLHRMLMLDEERG